jgi:hypothetical protein
MGDMPHNRHGLIPMLVAIRVAAERKRRREAAEVAAQGTVTPEKPKKKRGWFG